MRLRRMRGGKALLVAFVLGLVVTPPATAQVRQGTAQWERPETPSLDNRPPEVETNRYLDTLGVSYDADAGTLTIRTRLFAPEKWGDNIDGVTFAIGSSCGSKDVSGTYYSGRKWVYPDD